MLSLALLATSLAHANPDTTVVFDSAGIRRPSLRLRSLALDWKPALLSKAVPVWGPRLPRQKLASIASAFTGNWSADFPRFKRMWPAAVKDGSWELLVAAFWRRIEGLDSDFGDGPPESQRPVILGQWADWIETVDVRLRPSLGEMTGRELYRSRKVPELLNGAVVRPGKELYVDMEGIRPNGPVAIRLQRWKRSGTSLTELVDLPSPPAWAPSQAEGRFLKVRLPDPGLYRIVLRSPGWYRQITAQATLVATLTAPTDSGALVWAPGPCKGGKRLLWRDAEGKADSVALGNAPLHIGLPPAADSGLVAVACGQDLSPLRLRRPRPEQEAVYFGFPEKDWYGRTVHRDPPSRSRDFGWHASLVATPEAVEEGGWLRLSGIVRHLDAYGRPDPAQADSLVLEIEQDSLPGIRRTVLPDPLGVWADSLRIMRDAHVFVSEIAAEGRIVARHVEPVVLARVRRAVDGSLSDVPASRGKRAVAEGAERWSGSEELQPGSLVLLSQGRLLDWRLAAGDTLRSVVVPPQAPAAYGGVIEVLQGDSASWSSNRIHLRRDDLAGEGWMGVTVTGVPDTVEAGAVLAPRFVPRQGPAAGARLVLALVPDSLAGSLGSQAKLLGQAWASQEMQMPDQPVGRGGYNNFASIWEELDAEREPDRIGRLGMLAAPGLCVQCRPWTGSTHWDGHIPEPDNRGLSFTLSTGRHASAPLDAPATWTGPVDVAADGTFPRALRWPARKGSWRIQAWGVDERGRLLAWEKAVVVR